MRFKLTYYIDAENEEDAMLEYNGNNPEFDDHTIEIVSEEEF